jgi:UPF0755 protein
MDIRSLIGCIYDTLSLHIVRKARLYAVLAVGFLFVTPLSVLLIPAGGFAKGTLVTVEKDASFGETAAMLEEKNIIGSALLFKALARASASDTVLQAGRYMFETPIGSALVLYRLVVGDTGIKSVRVTIPEGSTVREMGDILSASIPGFDTATFRAEAIPYEGYLFPDTYEIFVDATSSEVIARMRARFNEVWKEVLVNTGDTSASEPQERIVIMASILEKETKLGPDRAIVSGILWKRIEIGMALQVDAVFGYIHDTDTYHPDLDDLEVDSPYNTYRNRDLPPGPIGNPGKDALEAALHPVASSHLYYLTGADSTVHYADTFEQHKANKAKYLR